MDRRTLLAVVLAGLVVVIYQFVFVPPPAQQGTDLENAASTDPIGESTPATDLTDRGVGSDAADPLNSFPDAESSESSSTDRPGAPEFVLTAASSTELVRTELYSASLESTGGLISSWQLQDYTDKQDHPAELVEDRDGLFEIDLMVDSGQISLSDAPFSINRIPRSDGDRYLLETSTADGMKVQISYGFDVDEYLADFDLLIDNAPNLRGDGEVIIAFPDGIPVLEDKIGGGMGGSSGGQSAIAFVDNKLWKESQEKRKPGWEKSNEGAIHWFGVRSRYFTSTLIAENPMFGTVEAKVDDNGKVRTELRVPLQETGPSRYSFQIYTGPMEYDRLSALDVGLENAVDLGWSWIRPFSRLLLFAMNWLHEFIPNYGVVIIILSVVTKLMFYPLTKKSLESMRALQVLKPEMDKLNEQYKDDPQRKQQEIFELYKKHKVNPLGGCLPMLVQMPVFVALYSVLSNAIELRKEPFFLWINDLSVPDAIGSLLGFPIHILPILMAVTMLIQSKLTPTDPRQAALTYIMPVMMLFFFYALPSGLVLYWTVSNVLQIGQQFMINRETRVEKAAA